MHGPTNKLYIKDYYNISNLDSSQNPWKLKFTILVQIEILFSVFSLNN